MGRPQQSLGQIYLGVDEEAILLKNKILQECEDKNLSVAAFVRLCVNEYFKNHPQTTRPPEPS